ncbi:hypothetical protein EYF80_010327 [Liparis tanakae]|uniref:Uncharacterized protein n=1 Tax=Liparis tanakae TaxID=230148 RepID=A0A4Z2IN76_9TELE|nr:hypothetical protein EYF80_010327 [Liparis tanakae]
MYRLHLPSTVLDPLQVDVAEAGTCHALQAVHVVFIDLHTEDLRVALYVVPLGVGLQRLLNGGVLEPGGQFGGVDQPSSRYLVAITSQASQRRLKAALHDSMWGKWPGSQQQHASSSSTPSVMASTSRCWQYVPGMEAPQLEGDEPVADLDEVDQGVEVVRGQDEAVSGAVVSPSAQHEVATEGVLQRASQFRSQNLTGLGYEEMKMALPRKGASGV